MTKILNSLLLGAAVLSTSVVSVLSNGMELDETAFAVVQSLLSQEGHKLGASDDEISFGRSGDRQLEVKLTCDAAFLKCFDDDICKSCFRDMSVRQIDWASLPTGTSCQGMLEVLHKSNHCTNVAQVVEGNIFCDTIHACAVTDDPENDTYNNNNNADKKDEIIPQVNCTELEVCDWPGIHKGFLGDGICHDNIRGCYNTAVCNYDGGDCCKDTCLKADQEANDGEYENGRQECGHDDYACRDPKSNECDTKLTTKCPAELHPDHQDQNKLPYGGKPCSADQVQYRVMMYDSFGDGWDKTTELTFMPADNWYERIFVGTLEGGSKGMEYVCLSKTPKCYRAEATGGSWGAESSWDVRPLRDGMPELAKGGAPMKCEFGVAGAECLNNCNGTSKVAPTNDPQYREFKTMFNCIEDKCMIQLQQCQKDPMCAECFKEEPSQTCMQIEHFNAVIDCAMCSCTERAATQFCATEVRPGRIEPKLPPVPNEEGQIIKECTGAQTMEGAQAVMDFAECSNFDSVGLMISKFDNKNFGELDNFETCSHAFANGTDDGRTAMACMLILKNAIKSPVGNGKPDAPTAAISSLAKLLYTDGESFCECASSTSSKCPQCPSFEQFKTLLYESMDACRSLDEIDCAAWKEFAPHCKTNILEKFSTVDFTKQEQCDYVQEDCGNAGPFPAFRRLDCATKGEVPKEHWDMYLDYSKNCLKDSPPISPPVTPPVSPPVASPTDPPVRPPDSEPTVPVSAPTEKTTPAPTKRPYIPPGEPTPSKPYVPPDDSDSSKSDVEPKKKKSHFWKWFLFLCALGGAGYWYYKRRQEAFSFNQYRRANQYDDHMMYGNLNSSTSFEPPSLPPTPTSMMSSVMNSMGMGGGGGSGYGYANQQPQQPQGGGYMGPSMS